MRDHKPQLPRMTQCRFCGEHLSEPVAVSGDCERCREDIRKLKVDLEAMREGAYYGGDLPTVSCPTCGTEFTYVGKVIVVCCNQHICASDDNSGYILGRRRGPAMSEIEGPMDIFPVTEEAGAPSFGECRDAFAEALDRAKMGDVEAMEQLPKLAKAYMEAAAR